MKFPSKNIIDSYKKRYPKGTRIELVNTTDLYSKLKCGDKGTVTFVDDIGTVFIDWDCGSSLGLIIGEDSFRIINEQIKE